MLIASGQNEGCEESGRVPIGYVRGVCENCSPLEYTNIQLRSYSLIKEIPRLFLCYKAHFDRIYFFSIV